MYVGIRADESISGTPTLNGQNFSLIGTVGTGADSTDCKGYWYERESPTTGALGLNFAVTVNHSFVVLFHFSGAGTVTIEDTDVDNAGSSTATVAATGLDTTDHTLLVGQFSGADGFGGAPLRPTETSGATLLS
jgi:hypothetical protein